MQSQDSQPVYMNVLIRCRKRRQVGRETDSESKFPLSNFGCNLALLILSVLSFFNAILLRLLAMVPSSSSKFSRLRLISVVVALNLGSTNASQWCENASAVKLCFRNNPNAVEYRQNLSFCFNETRARAANYLVRLTHSCLRAYCQSVAAEPRDPLSCRSRNRSAFSI